MKSFHGNAWVAVLVTLLSSAAASASATSGFERMMADYESVRQTLLHDGTDGIAAHAEAIRDTAEEIENLAGIAQELKDLLPSIRGSASRLAEASDIGQAREIFGELSKDLVRYRQTIGAAKPAVVFCSMAQKVWLQPKGEIGNPYHGQSMARCGQIVSE